MLYLLFWVYRTTKRWGLAFIVAGYLEWPIKNDELKNKLTSGQTQLLRISSIMKSSIPIAIVATIAIVLAIKILEN